MASDTEQNTNKIERSFEEMSASFKRVGTRMAVTGAAITAALTGLAYAGGKDMEANARLQIAIENTGVAYDSVKGRIDSLIESQQNTTNYSNNQQTDALNNLVLVTGNVETAMARLPLVLDLAAAKGIDLTTASEYVGKAMQGEYESLNRLLPGIKDCANASEALAFIQNKVTGAAQATANPLTQLKNNFGALAEKIGSALLPVFKGFLDIVTPIIDAVKNWIDHNQALATFLGGLALVIGVVVGAIGIFMPIIFKLVELKKAWTAIQISLNIAMYANPIGIIILAVVALIAVVVLVIKHFDTLKKWFVDGWETIKNAFVTAWNAIRNVFATVFNGIMTGVEAFVNFFIGGINVIIRALNGLSFTMPSWLGGGTFGINITEIAKVSLPKIAILDTGGYVPPVPGGTPAILAASGEGEYVLTQSQMAAVTNNANRMEIHMHMEGSSFTIPDESYLDKMADKISEKIAGQVNLKARFV
jgi:hypothetical protein